MDLVHLLVWLIVFCLIAGLVFYVVQLLPLPAPFRTIIVIAVCLILLLVLLNFVGLLGTPARLAALAPAAMALAA